jgi:hypothetical protein
MGGIPAAPGVPNIPLKGSTKKPPLYVWMPDKKGNLVRQEASIAKKAFATLGSDALVSLTEFLIQTNKQPSTAGLKSLWNTIIDGAAAQYKAGKKQTPWDVLNIVKNNTPISPGVYSSSYVQYDQSSADALLNVTARGIGFDINKLSAADRADFAAKVAAAAKESGKVTTKKTTEGGLESVTTPTTFNASTFAEQYLWAKVNVGDVKSLPTKAITSLNAIRSLVQANGLSSISPAEMTRMAIDVASGTTNVETLKIQFSEKAALEYPIYADRLKANPGVTVTDLVSSKINAVVKWWETDASSFSLNDGSDAANIIDKAIRPDGATGKIPEMSNADFVTLLKNHPKAEATMWANDSARSAAVGIGRAMGYGV